MQCWEQRGCDVQMAATCPHATSSDDKVCVADCYYTQCTKPQHAFAVELDVLLDPSVDRKLAIKETCRTCVYFLTNGPRVQA